MRTVQTDFDSLGRECIGWKPMIRCFASARITSVCSGVGSAFNEDSVFLTCSATSNKNPPIFTLQMSVRDFASTSVRTSKQPPIILQAYDVGERGVVDSRSA